MTPYSGLKMHQKSLTDFIFTSESVSEGHPDKICDQISDALLDHFMSKDAYSRTAIETAVTTRSVTIIGEIRGPSDITKDHMEEVVRQTIKKIGYTQEDFHWENVPIDNKLHQQSVDIAMGVDSSDSKDEGAGDQGIMFGYACRETDVLMPAPIHYSHALLKSLADARHSGELADLGPDSKSQVTLEYKDGIPVRATSVVLSTQHSERVSQSDVRDMVIPHIRKILPDGWMPADEELYINPTGRFVIGGPVGDAGLTGRKIIVDTYGGAAPHGGGAFSGKDPTKVDRSAAYAARYIAKNLVAANMCDKCTVQLSYAIGVSKPISIYVNTHGTGSVSEDSIVKAINENIDLSPRGIREHLQLNRPIFQRTAAYGHFGRKPDNDGGFSWEKTDLAEKLQKSVG